MKRFNVLALVLCACLVTVARAQQSPGPPHSGKQRLLRHRVLSGMPNTPNATGNLSYYGPPAHDGSLKTWDLGHHPGGSWADLYGVNNLEVAAGWGDVDGQTRMIGVPLFGPSAGKWFDSGISSDDVDGWSVEGGRISDTGLIVGGIKGENGHARAYAWTPNHPGIDLGTLEGDIGSVAIAVNHTGTLIVGVSYQETKATPVAWTPQLGWQQGRPAITWKIHELPTGGMEQPGQVFAGVTLNWWGSWGVNDLGQIAGDAWSDDYDETAVVWNPIRGSNGWEVQQLPHQSSFGFVADHKYTEALSINNLGEIAGDVSIDYWWPALPAIWRISPSTHTWQLTELPTLSGQRFGWNVAWSINEIGDVVGLSTPVCCNSDDWTSIATRWLTKNSSFVKAIGFPGDASQAYQVNSFGIAAGSYSSGGGPDQAFSASIH
ncbi:MAG: hypothetical protein WCB12_08335 [Bryobacteraceae bacterium]